MLFLFPCHFPCFPWGSLEQGIMWRWLGFCDLGYSLSYSEFPVTSAVSYAISHTHWLEMDADSFSLLLLFCTSFSIPPISQLFLVSNRSEVAPGPADLVCTLPWSHALWFTSSQLDLGSGIVHSSLQPLFTCQWGHVVHVTWERSQLG